MRPLSHYLFAALPAALALLLLLLTITPLDATALTYTPNIAWLMTLVMGAFYPAGWPRGWAFLLGLLQDILFGTPLGSQALLALLLAQLALLQVQRQQTPLFRMRWLEASCVLVLWHVLLWAIIQAVTQSEPSLRALISVGLINALWYPVFYWMTTRLFAALPEAK